MKNLYTDFKRLKSLTSSFAGRWLSYPSSPVVSSQHGKRSPPPQEAHQMPLSDAQGTSGRPLQTRGGQQCAYSSQTQLPCNLKKETFFLILNETFLPMTKQNLNINCMTKSHFRSTMAICCSVIQDIIIFKLCLELLFGD